MLRQGHCRNLCKRRRLPQVQVRYLGAPTRTRRKWACSNRLGEGTLSSQRTTSWNLGLIRCAFGRHAWVCKLEPCPNGVRFEGEFECRHCHEPAPFNFRTLEHGIYDRIAAKIVKQIMRASGIPRTFLKKKDTRTAAEAKNGSYS